MAQSTRPKNRREFMNSLVEPYSPHNDNPNNIYTEPKKSGMPEIPRSYQISAKHDNDKDFYIGIKDIDEAVMYYFKDVLKLSVTQNNTKIDIPILYASPENWKSSQLDGYYRDVQGKMMAPLLVFKRESVAQNRALGNKLDGNNVHNVQLFEKKYSKRNFYSNFSVLANRSPEKEYIVSMTPDYVTVQYSCVVWTYFVEQMDKLIEALNFSSRSYWGDPNKFQFYSSIDTFTDSIVYGVGEERAIKCSFNIAVNGYLIPDTINKKMANASKYYGISQIVFGIETATSAEEITVRAAKPASKALASVVAADSTNVTVNNITNIGGSTIAINTYLATSITKIANSVSAPNQATITGGTFLQPPAESGLPATDKTNFTYFINGQYVPVNFVTSFNGSLVVFDVAGLGYDLETDDEVSIIGKFA